MAIDFDKIIENDAFKNIEREKIEAVKQMSTEIQGKNMMEAMAVLSKYSNTLNQGKPISNEERNLMISVILEGMNEEDQKKFQSVIKMIGLMNK